jgi:hypothetical protein
MLHRIAMTMQRFAQVKLDKRQSLRHQGKFRDRQH